MLALVSVIVTRPRFETADTVTPRRRTRRASKPRSVPVASGHHVLDMQTAVEVWAIAQDPDALADMEPLEAA